jgi:hypothetical protein
MGENKWGPLGTGCHCGLRKILCKSPLVSASAPLKWSSSGASSFYQPLGPVSIRRRSAAQACADAHTDSIAPGDGWIGRIDDGFRAGYRFSQVFSGLIKT